MTLQDPEVVRLEYATEAGLTTRKRAYEALAGEVDGSRTTLAASGGPPEFDGPLCVRRAPVVFAATM